IAVHGHPREVRAHLRGEVVGQPVRILHRVELHQARGRGDVVGTHREDLFPDEVAGALAHPPSFSRISALRAWASSPSARARVAATRPRVRAPAAETEITLERFSK